AHASASLVQRLIHLIDRERVARAKALALAENVLAKRDRVRRVAVDVCKTACATPDRVASPLVRRPRIASHSHAATARTRHRAAVERIASVILVPGVRPIRAAPREE